MRLLLALLAVTASPAAAVMCENITHRDQSFTICTVDATTETLRLFHRDDNGTVLGQFSAIQANYGPLSFAMNAGMYHEDRSPVGLYVEDRKQTMRIITSDGPGNFGLLPNGVLCLTDTSAHVIESLRYETASPDCRDATQSGPMLVIDGVLHPRFLPDGTSKYIRNGVGTRDDGRMAIFAISNQPVNFYDFATLFRDHLETPNALFFDGNISRLYAPSLNRADAGFPLGPMVGVLD